jgi:hypothetical protein
MATVIMFNKHGMIHDTMYDMIWYDTIWYDMIYHMIRYDMIWYMIRYDMIYDMIWYDTICMIWYIIYDMTWYDIWYDMIRYDIWYDTIWYMIWYDIWYDTTRYDMLWYDMIWYDMIQFEQIVSAIKHSVASSWFYSLHLYNDARTNIHQKQFNAHISVFLTLSSILIIICTARFSINRGDLYFYP